MQRQHMKLLRGNVKLVEPAVATAGCCYCLKAGWTLHQVWSLCSEFLQLLGIYMPLLSKGWMDIAPGVVTLL